MHWPWGMEIDVQNWLQHKNTEGIQTRNHKNTEGTLAKPGLSLCQAATVDEIAVAEKLKTTKRQFYAAITLYGSG